MEKSDKALVILSGGQDSTTCLFWALGNFEHVEAVTFDYGQRHSVEIEAARKVAELAGVHHVVVELAGLLGGSSPLVNMDNEVGTYESAEVLPGGLEQTFVPGRNILFLTIAGSMASVREIGNLVTGVAQEDFGGYPDCRQSFISAMQEALAEGLGHGMAILTPLMDLDKQATVEMAMEYEGCMDALAYSHTCYQGSVPPCGKCHACLLRERGFELAGAEDPLLWRLGGLE